MKGHVRQAKDKTGRTLRGVWDTVIDIGVDPITGKRKQQWKRVRGTKEQAQEYVDARVREITLGIHTVDDKVTFGAFALKWLEDHAEHRRTRTYISYEMIVKRHLIPFMGHYRLRALSDEVIRDYYRHALTKGKLDRQGKPTGERLSSTTVNGHHRILSMILDEAYRRHLVVRNVAQDVKPPPKGRHQSKFLSAAQVRKLLAAAKERRSRFLPLYVATVTTGMRAGELYGWRWEDIDLERGVGRILEALEKPGHNPVVDLTKSNAGRPILLVPTLVETLKEWKAKQEEEKALYGAEYQDYGLVFTVADGSPIHHGNLTRRDFKPLLEAAGLPDIRFHELRHSAASILLEMGVHPKIVAEILGHSTTKLTTDTYSHAVVGLQSVAVEAMEKALFGSNADQTTDGNGS